MNSDERTPPDRDGDSSPGAFAVSPELGPIPAIYAPATPGENSNPFAFWRAMARSVRRSRTRNWARCQARLKYVLGPNAGRSNALLSTSDGLQCPYAVEAACAWCTTHAARNTSP
jgi:hypothetical protein